MLIKADKKSENETGNKYRLINSDTKDHFDLDAELTAFENNRPEGVFTIVSVSRELFTPPLGVVHLPIDVNAHPPNCAPPLGVCVCAVLVVYSYT